MFCITFHFNQPPVFEFFFFYPFRNFKSVMLISFFKRTQLLIVLIQSKLIFSMLASHWLIDVLYMISSNDNCFDKHTFDDWSVAVEPLIPADWAVVLAIVFPEPAELFPVTEHNSGIVSVQPGVWFTSSLILKLLSNWLNFLLLFKLLSLHFCCGIIIGLMLGKRYKIYQFWK